MASIKKDGSSMGLPMNINRGNPIPVDSTSIWYSLEEAQEYATNGATSYVGQILTVVNETEGTSVAYIIEDTSGTLKNLSSSGEDKPIWGPIQ